MLKLFTDQRPKKRPPKLRPSPGRSFRNFVNTSLQEKPRRYFSWLFKIDLRFQSKYFFTTTLSFTHRFYLPNAVSKTGSQTTSFLLRWKNPRIDTIRGFCLVKRLDKLPQRLPFIRLRHGVWQIDYICQTQLVRQSARPLLNVTTRRGENDYFSPMSQ